MASAEQHSPVQILYTDDLCSGEQVFFAATGVSDGDLLRGVRYFSGGASTNSIVMRSQSGTGDVQLGSRLGRVSCVTGLLVAADKIALHSSSCHAQVVQAQCLPHLLHRRA